VVADPENTSTQEHLMDDIRSAFARAGLYRSDDRILGGVCAGLGHRVGLDPWPARLLTFLLMVLVPGSPLLIYPVLWILMPSVGYGVRGTGTGTGAGPTSW
jgi:phage shock protein PspC (stress-responsive transcriptional regulator)